MSPKKKPSAPIYNRVRVLRAERDMSRAQLAEAIDVNPQTVGALDLPVEAIFSRQEFAPMSTEIYRKNS